MQRATSLSEIPSVTKPEPLDGDALEQFYVPADKARDPVAPPSSWLRDSLHEDPIRLLFASHPGSGKSTELNRLMREAKDDFWFLKLSIEYNGSGWYDVHPLMREALYEMGWMDGRLA